MSRNTDVIYQIYPLTFYHKQGSQSDPYKGAYGNLKGITEKIDYIKSLNVDSVWICPFYEWNKTGMGYDIIDYYNVGKMFGTNEDFKELTDKFHKNGIKVIVDQVYNHCSMEHEWFKKSVERKEPYTDYFVWVDPKGFDKKGEPIAPTNWPSTWDSSGESAWTWNDDRKQFYLHSFDYSMPNLNLNNHRVQKEMLKVAKHWFDLGADGFRLDGTCHYGYDARLVDNPINKEDTTEQHRFYDINQEVGAEFINRIANLANSYDPPKMLLSEFVFDKGKYGNKKGERVIKKSICESFYIGSLRGELKDFIPQVKEAMRISPNGEKLNWALSNHDMERVATRWFGQNSTPQKVKMATEMLLSLPGSACIFQGEELGLINPDIKRVKNPKNDPKEVWTNAGMPWDGARIMCFDTAQDSVNGKMAVYPSTQQRLRAADRQEDDRDSILNYTREAIKRRQNDPVFKEHGNVEFIETGNEDVIAFIRTNKNKTAQRKCVFNFTNAPVRIKFNEKETIEVGAMNMFKDCIANSSFNSIEAMKARGLRNG